MADRLRDLIDLVLGSLDEPAADGARAGAAGALLARPPGPAAGRGDRRVAGARCGAGCCSSARPGSCASAPRAPRRPRPPPATARSPRSRAPSRAPTGCRRAPSPPRGAGRARRAQRDPLPPAGRPAAARTAAGGCGRGARPVLARMVGHHLDARAGAARRRPTRSERPRSSARCDPGSSPSGSRARRPSAAVMAERLVFTLEVWVAAMAGEPFPERREGALLRALRARRARLRADRARDPRPRRVGRRLRGRALRAAAVVHLRRRARARDLTTGRSARTPWPACSPSSAPRSPPAIRSSGRRAASSRKRLRGRASAQRPVRPAPTLAPPPPPMRLIPCRKIREGDGARPRRARRPARHGAPAAHGRDPLRALRAGAPAGRHRLGLDRGRARPRHRRRRAAHRRDPREGPPGHGRGARRRPAPP